MSIAAAKPHSPTTAWRIWLLRAIAAALALIMLIYGVAAIDTGIVNFKGAGNADIAAKRMDIVRAAEVGETNENTRTLSEHSGIAVAFLSKYASAKYSYGKDGLGETAAAYATVPKTNGIALSLHNALAGTCMLFGALQFWPALRRRFPLWHRAFGGIYILAAQAAMIGAMYYLVHTPVVAIYDHLTFYVGLWALAIGVTLTLWLAIYSMLRKQIAQHQAFMCLNYGMLLTAPIQRYGWLAFGAMGPQDMRQLEANYAVTAVLVPLTVMIGYALFTINRWTQTDRSASAKQKTAQPFALHAKLGRGLAMLSPLALLAAGVTVVQHFVIQPGLSKLDQASQMIPAGVLDMTNKVVAEHPSSRLLFALATLVGLLGAARLLWQAFVSQRAPAHYMGASTWALAASGMTVGAVLLNWGLAMGMPTFATLEGGAGYLFGGAIAMLFSSLLAMALIQREHTWVKEWGVFVTATLIAVPSFFWQFNLIATLPISAQFIQEGHVFRMASAGQWMLLIGAFVYAMFSEATHSKLAR